MPSLLISVRNVDEAAIALRGGADVIDIKEPNAGSLGAADDQVWHDVSTLINSAVPLSVACGELRDYDAANQENQSFKQIDSRSWRGIQYAKVGTSKQRSNQYWQNDWKNWSATLPMNVQPVLVGYADAADCDAPSIDQLFNFVGTSLSLDGKFKWRRPSLILIDTYTKDGRGLFDFLSPRNCQAMVERARNANLRIAIAGSLNRETIATACEIHPDIIAVRGAACIGDRNAKIDEQCVREIAGLISSASQQSKRSLI